MRVNVQKFLEECGLDDPVYPGKRLVQKLQQPGEFKSHCVVYDWHNPDLLKIEVKAGLNGHTLAAKELARYPVSFQAATFLEIAVNDDEDDEEGEDGRGKSGGGGKGLKKKRGMDAQKNTALNAFLNVAEGKLPEMGAIKQLVVMGKQIVNDAIAPVLESLVAQIRHAKISPTDLLAHAGKFVTKYTPPAFLQPKGDEDKVYKYDREKNEPMFGKPTIG